MPEQFRNDRPYGIDIPRYGIYAAPGATFTVPDDDMGSLNDDPGYTNLNGAVVDLVFLTEVGDLLTAESGDLLITA